MNKKTIGVIFGGVSTEHEISLKSASFIIENIDTDMFNVKTIGITKNGDWFLYSGDTEKIKNNSWMDEKYIQPITLSLDPNKPGFFVIDKTTGLSTFEKIDAAFPVLHGINGEDGSVQALLKIANIPFVGCDFVSSAICMDKELTHIILNNAGVPTTPYLSLKKYDFEHCNFDELEKIYEAKLNYPMFVKPANAGSSFGISKAKNKDQLLEAINLAFKIDKKIIIEKTIVAREIECAVIGKDEPFASILGEICPCNEFYDYDAKYISDNSLLYIPAEIDEEISNKIRETAKKAFKALGCCGMARIDFFLTESNEIFLNEPNTIPGFTKISMYPKLLMASGMKSEEIINKLIGFALEQYEETVTYNKQALSKIH